MPLEKLNGFTKDVSDLADKPNATMTAAELKAQFDAAPDEVRIYLNKLIDALSKTTDGDSGADNVKATTISGLSGSTVQAILESLKDYTDNILSGEIGAIPYTGATKHVDLNGKNLYNVAAVKYTDAKNDNILFQWVEDSVTGNLELRTYDPQNFLNDLLEITPGGILNFIKQSFVDVIRTTAQTCVHGTNTKILYDPALTDRQGEFVSNKFTAKQTGKYHINSCATWSTIPTGENYFRIYKNGSFLRDIGYSTGNNKYIFSNDIVNLSAGEYLEFYVAQFSGGTDKALSSVTTKITKIL